MRTEYGTGGFLRDPERQEATSKPELTKGFPTEEEIKDKIKGFLEQQGVSFSDIDFREKVIDREGNIYAAKIHLKNEEENADQEINQTAWVTLMPPNAENREFWHLQINFAENEANICDLDLRAEGAVQEMETDRYEKKVTPRTASAYPREFGLPYREVFPKDAKVMVVGDPYQKIDRPDYVLIDYEYANEMIPPLLDWSLDSDASRDQIEHAIVRWYEDLHFGDSIAVEKRYHGAFHTQGDPIQLVINDMRRDMASFASKRIHDAVTGDDWEELQRDYRARCATYHAFIGKLVDGKLTEKDLGLLRDLAGNSELLKSAKEFLNIESTDPEVQEKVFKEPQQDWQEYIDKAYKALEGAHDDSMEVFIRPVGVDPNDSRFTFKTYELDDQIDRDAAKKILKKLQTHLDTIIGVRSAARRNVLQNKMFECIEKLEQLGYADTKAVDLYDVHLGGVVSHRIEQYMLNTHAEMLTMERYLDKYLPLLLKEKERVEAIAELPKETLNLYLSSFDHDLRRALFEKQAKHSHVLHGFFPGNMPQVDSQMDRVVALYSVSTHVWDSYRHPQEFEQNILDSLAYIKTGGKYILGPINYKKHRLGFDTDFDGTSLHRALEKLKDEGVIDYVFMKNGEDRHEFREGEEFAANDSAASLIITKLKE